MGFLPQWDQSILGMQIDVVLQLVLQKDNNTAIMRLLGTNQHVEVHDVELGKGLLFTMLGLQVLAVTPRPIAQVDESTRVFVHSPTSYASVHRCIELCAGAGFMGQGAKASGFNPVLGVEQNSRFATLFHSQHEGRFLCKDIGHPDAVATALEMGNSGATVLSGFSCQPFSCAGDRKGFRDSRSDALPSSLRFAWLVQSPLVILECTPLAKDDPNVQAVLAEFLQLTGFQMTQQILKLSNCWAARRDRWWCVMYPRVLGPLQLPDLPVMPEFQVVAKVMPYVKHWPEKDVAELVLSLHEHLKFLSYAGPLESLALDMTKPLPTALHAWGNQIYPCGCGCRAGLSEERLKTRGLHGVLIPGKETLEHDGLSFPECRHLHPAEVLLLCGGRPDLPFDSMRLGLAAVGQLASPIQSLWVLSHVERLLAAFVGDTSRDPKQVLSDYQQQLLSVRDSMWPPLEDPKVVPTRMEPLLNVEEGFVLVDLHLEGLANSLCHRIRVKQGQTVAHLCTAEAALRQVPVDTLWAETHDGHRLAPEHALTVGDLIVVVGNLEPPVASRVASGPRDLPERAVVPFVSREVPVARDLPEPAAVPLPDASPSLTVETPVADRLTLVPREGLLKLLIPTVATTEALASLKAQQIDGNSRRTVLTTQGDLWADDQLFFHLTELAQQVGGEQVVRVWDPLAVTSLFRSPHSRVISDWVDNFPSKVTIVTAVLVDCSSCKHWVPIVWRWTDGSLEGYFYGIPSPLRDAFGILHQWLCKAVGSSFTELTNATSCFSSHCGAVAIAFVRHLVSTHPMVLPADIVAFHGELCHRFEQSLATSCPRPWIWGQGFDDSSSDSALIALLRQHGVPSSEATERAAVVCRTIGREKVVDALSKPAPWKELKWLANQCVPMLKLIRPAELQQVIEEKSQSTGSVGNRSMKKKGQGKGKQPALIDPSSIRIAEGTFVSGESQPVQQIQVHQIGPLQAGVVLASLDQALPFISQNRQVSLGSLAIIVLNMPDTPPGLPLIAEKVTFPGICAANSEPLILTGSMFQLGATPVTRASASQLVTLKSIQTCVIKLSVYRDALGLQWSEFCERPLHHLVQLVPVLMMCKEEGCNSCPHWHGNDSDLRDPILGVWNRQWLTHSFGVTSPPNADMFSVTLRLPQDLEDGAFHFG